MPSNNLWPAIVLTLGGAFVVAWIVVGWVGIVTFIALCLLLRLV